MKLLEGVEHDVFREMEMERIVELMDSSIFLIVRMYLMKMKRHLFRDWEG